MRSLTLAALAVIPCLAALPAFAAASDWHHVEGGKIRVVTSGTPDTEGVLHGALEIRLKPGWKTYWRDPGDSGVPPTVEFAPLAEGASVDVGFPAPKRFDDHYSSWSGYDHPVSLPLTLRLGPGADVGSLDAQVFLGVCETICVPVQATLVVELNGEASDAEDAAVVAEAFAALPGPARPGFEATVAASEAEMLSIEIASPASARIVDLFVAGSPDLALGTPRSDGAAGFTVPILRGKAAPGETLPYTLVTTSGAVEGKLVLP